MLLRKPKVGLFGARADRRGLSYQTQAFSRWLEPTRVWGIDMTADNLSPYSCDWRSYENRDFTVSSFSEITEELVRGWMRGLDVIIGAETFYKEEFVTWARHEGVRTVLQINPEFTAFWTRRGHKDPRPDVMVAPTTWRLATLKGVRHLPFPVDRREFPFRLREKAETFVHIAGHKAMNDRAGVRILLGAIPYLRYSDAKVVLRTQSPLDFTTPLLSHIKVEDETPDPRDLYWDADVILHPRRYGGNSLVINEALSSGCPVIVIDRDPENTWGGTVPIRGRLRGNIRTKGGFLPLYDARGEELSAAVLDLLKDPTVVRRLSEQANEYAQTISWDTLLPKYRDLLAEDL